MSEADAKFLVWLDSIIIQAEEDAAESHREAMNSYGAGYDAAYAAALKRTRTVFLGNDDPCE
jgi:bisphosphoglycerate-dependent phosphoglycerate mutase